jgi:hypothetical protein
MIKGSVDIFFRAAIPGIPTSKIGHKKATGQQFGKVLSEEAFDYTDVLGAQSHNM